MDARLFDLDPDRKARGAFFTPPKLAEFVAQWSIRTQNDTVLEPSCGEADFLVPMLSRLRHLGAEISTAQLSGIELHDQSAQTAQARLQSQGAAADITVGDFFDVSASPVFDVVSGNPPYVRYQDFAGVARSKAQEAALAQGVRLGGLASSWAAFVIHAASFLKPDGRLGLVLPAELLSVNYAAPVRTFLLNRFANVRLVLFEERVFPGVQEEVVLLLAEGQGPTDGLSVCQVKNADGLGELVPREFIPPEAKGKWTQALLPAHAVKTYTDLVMADSFTDLSSWGDPDLGMVTGRNAFFALSEARAQLLGLDPSELLAISPPGSRHLRGTSFGKADWNYLRAVGKSSYLFYPSDEPSPAARDYIAHGESEGIHAAYKCRMRSPWWRVPLVSIPDVFLTYMNSDAPRLVANRAGVRHLNSIHGLVLKPGRKRHGTELLPVAFLNSVSLLGAELVGRAYGGGILKVEPREANVLPVPSPELIARASEDLRRVRPQVDEALADGDLGMALEIVDEVLLTQYLGVSRHTLATVRKARQHMSDRRGSRNGGSR